MKACGALARRIPIHTGYVHTYLDTSRKAAGNKKPLVALNMAFRDSGFVGRPMLAVTGAAKCLADILGKFGIADFFFLDAPLINREARFEFPKDLDVDNRPLIFAMPLFEDRMLDAIKEVNEIKKRYPQARIILGGPAVSLCPDLKELSRSFPEGIAFVKGDGEAIIVPVVRALSGEEIAYELLGELPGVYYEDQFFEVQDERCNTLTQEEFNAYPLTTPYAALIQDIENNGYLALHTSRGCLYRCVFCSHKYHPAPLFWSAERIIQELEHIRTMIEEKTLPPEARNIHFTDDDFFQDRERAVTFLRMLTAKPADGRGPSLADYFSFSFMGSVGSFLVREGRERGIDIELLDSLAAVGPRGISLGTDGFHPEALVFLNKGGYKLRHVQALTEALGERNIPQLHYVILTYPEMTQATLIETLRVLYEISEVAVPQVTFSFNIYPNVHQHTALARLVEQEQYFLLDLRKIGKDNTPEHIYVSWDLPPQDRDVLTNLNKLWQIPFGYWWESTEGALRHIGGLQAELDAIVASRVDFLVNAGISFRTALGTVVNPYLQKYMVGFMWYYFMQLERKSPSAEPPIMDERTDELYASMERVWGRVI